MSQYPQIGSEFGNYRIESQLGRGGMSVVYLAQHLTLERKVALKLLSPDLSEDPTFRDRFVRESRVAASLDHPNIIPIYEAGEESGVLFIAMRYVKGTDLKALIKQEGSLGLERTSSILTQVAGALDAAHDEGLIHRDIKPANILIGARSASDPGDQVYLSDFGLTKRSSGATGLTATGQMMGTVDYIAPEQIRGEALDRRTDIYALGCVAFECLTGHIPFQKDAEAAVLYAHLQSEPPSVTESRPDLPDQLDPVVARAMAKQPDDRYATAGAFAQAVRAVGGVATGERPVLLPRGGGSKRRWLVASAAAVVVAAAVGVAVALGGGGTGAGGRSAGGRSPEPPASPIAHVVGTYAIDPATGDVKSSTPTAYPYAVTAGDGVWVAENGRIEKINPGSAQKVGSIDTPNVIDTDIATGGGAVWVVGEAPQEAIEVLRIDPSSNTVAATITVGHLKPNTPGNESVSVGEGAVWAILSPPSLLVKIDPATSKVLDKRRLPISVDQVVAGGGSVWVRSSLEATVLRIDPKTLKMKQTVPLSGADAMAYGAGALWVADRSSGTMTKVDPDTGKPSATVSVGGSPSAIAADDDAVWVVNFSADAIARVDPLTNKVVGTTPLSGGRDIAVGEGAVWVGSCGSSGCT